MTLHMYADCFSLCPDITSKFCTIAIIRSFVEQNNDSNKVKYAHELSLQ
jgi:hypothetical protein